MHSRDVRSRRACTLSSRLKNTPSHAIGAVRAEALVPCPRTRMPLRGARRLVPPLAMVQAGRIAHKTHPSARSS